jgi:excisionase family DNA binding protein
MKKQKDPSLVRQFDKAHCRLRSPQASLSETILQKLTTLEELLKKKDDKPLTFKEACSYLGYAPSYLYKLTYRNVIPHYKPTGKMIFFSKNELDQWIYKSNVKLRIENAELKDSNNVEKDPNQMEMDLYEKGKRKKEKEQAEIIIEFPLKSRRNSIST